jgi:hypothetical protein
MKKGIKMGMMALLFLSSLPLSNRRDKKKRE